MNAAHRIEPSRTRDSRWVPQVAGDAADWLSARLPAGAALCSDSRRLRAGDAFFAFPGSASDGRCFIDEALARGVTAIVGERPVSQASACAVPILELDGLRGLAGPIASAYHGVPSAAVEVVAVTGTNGKTSTTQWIARGLGALGRRAAVVGTLGCGVVGELQDTGLTTPDALEFQSMLARYRDAGVETVAVEASSIGLDQGRLNGTRLAVAAFTNLTRDHLDYHGTMQAYAQAKRALFAWPGLGAVVVNGDDPSASLMLEAVRTDDVAPRRIVYGLTPGRHGARGDAVLIAERVVDDDSGLQMTVSGDFGTADVRLGLVGGFNASNALAVAGCWLALGHPFDRVIEALQSLEPVSGRMQKIELPGAPLVVVDYAHSPDALDSVLAALRKVAIRRTGRLWCVFGAGGERDPGKRPEMGQVAERGADCVVITSDNPRGESPFRIVSGIRAGLTREPTLTELDRATAIRAAVLGAAPADVVLVAGKGHEAYQEIAGTRHPFSDVEVVRAVLSERAEAARV